MGPADAYRLAQRVRDKGFSLLVGRDFAVFGTSSVVQPPLRLVGEEQIAVGAGVFVGAGSWLQVIGLPDDGPRLRIGDGTSMSGTCVVSAVERITIGRRVLFARNVYVADHTHSTGDATRAVLDQGVESIAPVEIGDGAWLGQNVVVLPGVRIGRGAVVGAGAVVRDDVPDFAVAVGAPARVVGDVRHRRAATRLAARGAS